jgi:hypothetical protein
MELAESINLTNVIFAFPTIRYKLPKNSKARILLWHSAVIFTIAEIRHRALAYSTNENSNMGALDFSQWGPLYQKTVTDTLKQIYYDYKAKGKLAEFEKNWVEGNSGNWKLDNGELKMVQDDFWYTS